jgi:uncharacterized protein (DUF2141 family)
MQLNLQDNTINKYWSLSKNRGMHMNNSSILRQPVLFINHQDSVDKTSDKSQPGTITASKISDYKGDSTYDADRLGAPKRMR